MRQDLLNPNARRLWLGHWEAWYGTGSSLKGFHATAYRIPQLPYREDVPTPSKRYEGATVAREWVDTEESVNVNGKRIPYVRCPADQETDVPVAFSNGKGSEDAGGEQAWFDPTEGEVHKSGVPIMVRFFGPVSLTDVEFELRDRDGKHVPCTVLTDKDTHRVRMDKWPSVLALPVAHLKQGVAYSIAMKCKLDGVPFEKSWSFRTRDKYRLARPGRWRHQPPVECQH